MFFLFLTRLLLYFIAITLPLIHSAISVSYDKISWFIWFGIVPAEFFLALLVKYIITKRSRKSKTLLNLSLITAFLVIILPVFFMSGFDSNAWRIIAAGTIAFLVTLCIFLFEEHGYLIALGELFTGGYFYIKLLRFSRASELIATENSSLTLFLLIICIVGFLIHSYILYSSAFFKKNNFKTPKIEVTQQQKEWVILLVLIMPILLLVILIPPNYVENKITLNTLNEPPLSPPVNLNDSGSGISEGNLQSNRNLSTTENNRQTTTSAESQNKENSEGSSQKLEGIPAQEWEKFTEMQSKSNQNNRSGQENSNQEGLSKENSDKNGSGQDNKQYAVMIMSSTKDPIYAANGYYEIFDSQKGFLFSENQPLNQLINQRLIDTWKNSENNNDKNRSLVSQTFFSTTSNRALAYLPEEIEPSIQQFKYHPFDLSYRALSKISGLNATSSYKVQPISNENRNSFANYLKTPVDENIRMNFDLHLNKYVDPKDDLLSQIEQILKSFSEFQYKIGFTDNVSTNHLNTFLTSTQSGDCTEFSNTVALMGRLIGVPTRVVTGYIGAKSLQSTQHQRGIRILRQDIAPLKDIPIDNLYLITNAHRHSWTQFWIPEFGWVDFESTKYAKRPPPGTDANSLDIVIPIINVEEEYSPVNYVFPWKLVSIIFLFITALVISSAYIFRFAREIRLNILSKQKNNQGLYALINLLYMKMATAGYVLKSPSETALEYAKRYPEIHLVATNYTILSYKKDFAINEKQRYWISLHNEYYRAIKIISPNKIKFLLLNLFSLRSLYY